MKKVEAWEAFKVLKPERCVFVISIDKHGKPSGMIAGWQMKCSRDPALIAVSLQKKGYTHKLIKQSKEFVVAVPNKKMEDDVMFFGSTHGDKVDKFKETGIKTMKAGKIKSPLLKEATINLECKLYKEVDAGDHIIFIGEVVMAHINPKKKVLLNMGWANDKRVFKEF